MSDFLYDPIESATFSEPWFLYLLNANIILQAFLLQREIVRIK